MNEKRPTYRVEINNNGIATNRSYGWQIYRNMDVLPILRSQQLFVSRMAGLADANRSRLQLVDADLKNRETKEREFYLGHWRFLKYLSFAWTGSTHRSATIKLRYYRPGVAEVRARALA